MRCVAVITDHSQCTDSIVCMPDPTGILHKVKSSGRCKYDAIENSDLCEEHQKLRNPERLR